MRVVVSEFMSLDGVVQAPGDEKTYGKIALLVGSNGPDLKASSDAAVLAATKRPANNQATGSSSATGNRNCSPTK